MALAVLGLGSNIERCRHLTQALNALAALADEAPLHLSRVFESPPVGFEDARAFYNLVVAFETVLPPNQLKDRCQRIERDSGRPEGPAKFVARTLDIDLLLWGDVISQTPELTLPRPDILHYAFVAHPLAELLPEHRHPVLGETYASLWATFDAADQPHWPVAFSWRGRELFRTPNAPRQDA